MSSTQQPVAGLTSADLYKLRSLGDVQLSPDAERVAYAVTRRVPRELFIHGENDSDVSIAEAAQYYSALKDVGVPTS